MLSFGMLSNKIAVSNEEMTSSNNNKIIRGISIDFTPPPIIQDCGSLFNLTVNLKNMRNLPKSFSLIVFMNITGENSENSIYRIGVKPFVGLAGNSNVSVEIPCLTHKYLLQNLNCLKSDDKFNLSFYNGRIGVKISKFPCWIIDGLYWNYIIKNQLLFNLAFITVLKDSPLWQFIASIIRLKDPFIKWSDTIKFTHPFVCTKKIKLYDVKFITEGEDNLVDKNENITVTFNVTNNLDEDIILSSLVDMSNERIFNSLFPSLPEEIYNLDFNETVVKKNKQNKTIWMNFTFPNTSFRRTTYTLTLECAPYINIQNTNLFGLYGYNYRYKTLVTPFYLENETVKKSAERFWYNLPIFNATEYGNQSIFLSRYFEFNYTGENPTEELVQEVLEELEKHYFEIVKWILIIIIPYALLCGLLNWIIRKKS